MADDPLAAERAAYTAAYRAATDAILDAHAVSKTHGHGPELLQATRHMVEREAAVLAEHDRITNRALQLGADPETVSRLHEGRAELVLRLQQAIAQQRRLEQDQASP